MSLEKIRKQVYDLRLEDLDRHPVTGKFTHGR